MQDIHLPHNCQTCKWRKVFLCLSVNVLHTRLQVTSQRLYILKINIQLLPSSSSINKKSYLHSVLRNLSIDFSVRHVNHLISIAADHHSIRRYLYILVPTIPPYFPQCSVGPVRCSAAWPCRALFRSDVKRPLAPENWCGWFRDT